MEVVDNIIENKCNIIRVKFETWRYEKEDQFALIPLKTISFALPDEDKIFGFKTKAKNRCNKFIKKTPDILTSIISKYAGDDSGKIITSN